MRSLRSSSVCLPIAGSRVPDFWCPTPEGNRPGLRPAAPPFDTGEVDTQAAAPSASNAALLRNYATYFAVEKGLRPLTCEAYATDLLQFAEFLEGSHTTLLSARQLEISGFLRHLAEHGVSTRAAARKLSWMD